MPALLAAFERRHGTDPEVRETAARVLLRARSARGLVLGPSYPVRLALGRARRRREESRVQGGAATWLEGLEEPSAPIRVTVVSPEPTPYRSPLFDLVAARPELELTVIYAAHTVAGRTWSVEPQHRSTFLRGLALPGLGRVLHHDYPVTPGIVRALRESRPDVVVVSGWSTFASQAAIVWCRRRGVPYLPLVESHDLGPAKGLAARCQGCSRAACAPPFSGCARTACALRVNNRRIPLPEMPDAVLQESGPAAGEVLVASSAGLLAVRLSDGAVRTVASGSGSPVTPVVVGGCRYAAWADRTTRPTITGLAVCGAEPAEPVTLTGLGPGPGSELSLRVRGDAVVLSDAGNGRSWIASDGFRPVDNWSDVTPDGPAKSTVIDEKQTSSDDLPRLPPDCTAVAARRAAGRRRRVRSPGRADHGAAGAGQRPGRRLHQRGHRLR